MQSSANRGRFLRVFGLSEAPRFLRAAIVADREYPAGVWEEERRKNGRTSPHQG